MRERTRKAVTLVMAVAAAGAAGAGIADAAKKKQPGKKGTKAHKRAAKGERHRSGGPGGHRFPPPEQLTGGDADKAKAAAIGAVPGGTVRQSFKAPDGGPDGNVAYVVMVSKGDGSPVLVLLDKDFKVVKTLDRPPRGPHGGPEGPHGGPPNEPELTGADAEKAKAAAQDAVPGGTVWRVSKEDPAESTGAAYEAHVRKADGSEVEVQLDSDFKVVKTEAGRQSGPPEGSEGPEGSERPEGSEGPEGSDGHHGPPPGAPGAGSDAEQSPPASNA